MNLSVVLVSQIKISHLFYPVWNNPQTRQLQILPDIIQVVTISPKAKLLKRCLIPSFKKSSRDQNKID